MKAARSALVQYWGRSVLERYTTADLHALVAEGERMQIKDPLLDLARLILKERLGASEAP